MVDINITQNHFFRPKNRITCYTTYLNKNQIYKFKKRDHKNGIFRAAVDMKLNFHFFIWGTIITFISLI